MGTSNKSYMALVEVAGYQQLIDSHGNNATERLIQQFHQRLKGWVRSDDQSQVLKNNRFVAILDGVNTDIELELATVKLTRLFEAPCHIQGQEVPIKIRAGFVLLGETADNTKDGVYQAGLALRQAKQAGTTYEIYDPEHHSRLMDEHQLVKALEAAVELGEFELYYQPKFHAGYRNLVGAEALIRWHTKEHKVLMPDDFIGVAERHPVIRPITYWVIKSAVAQLAKWEESVSIAVNITPTVLLDDEIYTVVKDALEIFGVKASRLTLEVTETIMVGSQHQMMTQLAQLRLLGVRVSIDDFGTGYSSLIYFRDLPADELKIDKGFVLAMQHSEKDRAIVKAVIDLAHNFSLKVVGEGVEDEATARWLTEMGCDYLQGYVFDKPLPLEDFTKRHLY